MSSCRRFFSLLGAALLASWSSFAFQSPLSEESIREAYFLGQRHDGSYPRLLEKYVRHLPPPKTGPYISYVTFLTPFAQLVGFSDRYLGNYSAQQAALDYRSKEETVEISVEIQFTRSYGAVVSVAPDAGSRAQPTPRLRPSGFWRDFRVQVFQDGESLIPADVTGKPTYLCGRRGGCTLTGARIYLTFPADAFTSDAATILVLPPEGGDPVSIDFDLAGLR
jgi:hypothetical protein